MSDNIHVPTQFDLDSWEAIRVAQAQIAERLRLLQLDLATLADRLASLDPTDPSSAVLTDASWAHKQWAEAWQAGRDHGLANGSRSANPYFNADEELRLAWDEGWVDGQDWLDTPGPDGEA